MTLQCHFQGVLDEDNMHFFILLHQIIFIYLFIYLFSIYFYLFLF